METNFLKNIEQPFGWEPNEIIFDPNLSLKAKGLWLYMNAKPEGWFFASERIAEECLDGVKGIRAALKELAEAGLLTGRKQKDGRIVYRLESEVTKPVENPKCPKGTLATQSAQKALCQNVTVPKCHCAKRAPINNKEDNKERIIIKKERAAAGFKPEELASWPPKRSDYESDADYEKDFYERNTLHVKVN